MDLGSLDRQVRNAHRVERAWRSGLATNPEQSSEEYPETLRGVARKSTRDELLEYKPAAYEVDLRDALARWVAHFVMLRITWPLWTGFERAKAEREVEVELEQPLRISWSEGRRLLLGTPELEGRRRLVDALGTRARQIQSLHAEICDVESEVARRFGMGKRPYFHAVPSDEIANFSRQFLQRTNDLAHHLRSEWGRRHAVDSIGFSEALPLALATTATRGWPARLTSRWLSEVLPRVAPHVSRPVRVPEALGGASFLLALERFGRAFAESGDPTCFALAESPEPLEPIRLGCLFSLLGSRGIFLRRALGLSEERSREQARVLGVAHFFEARRRVAGYLVQGGEDSDELTNASFGRALPKAYVASWSAVTDGNAAVGVWGLATTLPLESNLVERFDEDWFRNPRAIEALLARRTLGSYEHLARDTTGNELAGVLARSIEHALA